MTEREPKSILQENEYLCILQYMHYDSIYIFENPLGKKTINAILTISKWNENKMLILCEQKQVVLKQ